MAASNTTTPDDDASITLADVCLRISCGIATGADSVFIRPLESLEPAIRRFAYPTLAGRQLRFETTDLPVNSGMLTPYDLNGRLLPIGELGALGEYLERAENRRRLEERTCVRHKPWYAFHETPVLSEILRPKILCKDICEQPRFWTDQDGRIVPRHSIYYLVPRNPSTIGVLMNFLNSPTARAWLNRNCQRASKGFLRLQSRVLQRLPIPNEIAELLGTPSAPSSHLRDAQAPLLIQFAR